MTTSSAPAAPSPTATASAQTGENVSTAIANADLSHVSQTNAYGDTSQYNQTGTTPFTDPTSGQTYQIPNYSQTTTLSQPQQSLYNTVQGAQQTGANTASGLISQAQGNLSTPINLGNDMTEAGAYQPNLGQYSVSPTSQNENLSGYNTNGASNNVNLSGNNVNPSDINNYVSTNWEQPFQTQWNNNQEQLNQHLADQGLNTDDQAYSTAQNQFGQEEQQAQDTYASNMYGTAANAALGSASQNSANAVNQANTNFGQEYQANSQGAANTNTAANTNFNQDLSANSLNSQNELNASQFGFNSNLGANQSNAGLQEQQYNQPVNELSALLGDSQVSSPTFSNTTQQNIPTTNYAQIAQNSYTDQLQQYQLQQQQNSAMYGGLFGLGSAAIMAA